MSWPGRRPPTVDSPLGDLIAGKVNQAEYRRRMEARRRNGDSVYATYAEGMRFDDSGTLVEGPVRQRPPYAGWDLDELPARTLPPAQPQGWVDPDPLDVQMQPVDPYPGSAAWVRRQPGYPEPDRRDARGCALFGLGVCAGILLSFAVFFLAPVLDGPTPQPPLERPVPAQGGTGAPVPARGSPSAEISAGAPSASLAPTGEVGTALIGGWATWYDVGPGLYGAAGPELRAALGDSWRGSTVTVDGPGRLSVTVQIVDFCACGDRHGQPTLLDLSIDAFEALAPIEQGIVPVSIEIPSAGVTTPPTDLPPHPDDERMRDEVRGDELYR